MVTATYLLAITGVLRGVELFAGPLWTTKFQYFVLRYHFYENPRARVAALYLIAVSNSVCGLCNISTSSYRFYKGRKRVCRSAVGRQIPVTRGSIGKGALF